MANQMVNPNHKATACVAPIWHEKVQLENGLCLRGKVPADLIFFAGHFADFPLVPGVVELQWAVEQTENYFGKKVNIARVDHLKFQKFLRPNDEIVLNLSWEEAKSRMKFQLKTEDEICASGLIVVQNG